MRNKTTDTPPTSHTPYRILGEIPWGGLEERPVLEGANISPDAHGAVLAECVKLMRTAEAAADVPSGHRITEAVSSAPINPFDLEQGIRMMGGSYATNEWISPLDVMLYTCRVVDRLLTEMGMRESGRPGGYPTNGEKMRDRVREIANDVYRAAAANNVPI